MPKRIPRIQDIAVIAEGFNSSPVGEALKRGELVPTYPMPPNERQGMFNRLGKSIYDLMDEAEKTYQSNCRKLGTEKVDQDYITRLSTNEFFFYTQEPLTLEEFQELQNHIANKAKFMSPGVQLILGSFAIKTHDDKVMNVTPHITCGESPHFQFMIKNATSAIDVRYKSPDGSGGTKTMGVLDVYNTSAIPPQITVNGITHNFTFNNIVTNKTPRGTRFLTAVDICLDHLDGVAKNNYRNLSSQYPNRIKYPVSHVVVSNWIPIAENNCITQPTHIDPVCSPQTCKKGVQQQTSQIVIPFGKDRVSKIVVDCPQHHLKNNYAYKTSDPSIGRKHSRAASVSNINFRNTQEDSPIFKKFKSKYQTLKGDHLKNKILKNLKRKIERISSKDKLDELKKEILSSHEYAVLKTGQGKFTRTFGIKTSSVKALENMFKQQEDYLSKNEGQNFQPR